MVNYNLNFVARPAWRPQPCGGQEWEVGGPVPCFGGGGVFFSGWLFLQPLSSCCQRAFVGSSGWGVTAGGPGFGDDGHALELDVGGTAL